MQHNRLAGSLAGLGLLLAAPLAAQVGYETGFEAFTASASGTPCAGQDGFYVPAVTGSIDSNIFTYAGNTLGVPANPLGGTKFFAGMSQGGTAFARSQRALTIPTTSRVRIEFDVCVVFTGSVTPTNNIGSFSFQPSSTAQYPNLLARWPTGVAFPPTVWNADLVVGPTAAGTQTTFPDPNFLGLPVGVWHRWGCTIDLTAGLYTEFRITNGATNVTTVFTPAPGAMPLPLQFGPLATDFRLFTGGGLGNVLAVDNLVIHHNADYIPYGNGCAGSAGVPALAAAPGSRPIQGGIFQAVLSNMPTPVGLVVTGFSNTSFPPFTLPLDLTQFGLPGCFLLAEPLDTQLVLGGSGTATWSLNIPPGSGFLGLPFYNQGFAQDPGTNPAGFVVSNGVRGVIGR